MNNPSEEMKKTKLPQSQDSVEIKKTRFSRELPFFVLALIPLLCLVYFVNKYMVDIPRLDHWMVAPLLEKSYEGSLTFSELAAQHNEHRPFFPVVIMIALARLSHWNVSYELTANILLSAGVFFAIAFQLRKTDKSINNHQPCWLIPIISLMIFSLNQCENWLWGFQIQVFLNVLAVTIGIVLLANYSAKWLYFILALFMGIVGTYSFANGLLYWFIGLLVLFFIAHQNKTQKIFKIIIWAAVSLIVIYTYLHNYHRPQHHPILTLFAKQPLEYIKYVLAYLGGFLCFYNVKGAIYAGLLGLIISALTIWKLIRVRGIKFQILVPYIALSFYSIGSAMITGMGRLGFGAAQALAPRYATLSYFFWISNLVFLYLYANTAKADLKNKIAALKSEREGGQKSRLDKLCQLCSYQIASHSRISSIITIVVVFVILNSLVATRYFKNHHAVFTPARNELRWPTGNDELLRRLDVSAELVKKRRVILKKYKLSVFRDSEL